MKQLRMPRHVDDPKQILVMTIDEVVPIGAGLITGVVIDKMWICLLVGIALARIQRRYIDSRPDGFLLHVLYWNALVPLGKNARSAPTAFKKLWTH